MAHFEKLRRLASWGQPGKHKPQPRVRLAVEQLESRALLDAGIAGGDLFNNGLTVNISDKIVDLPDPVDGSFLVEPNTGPSLRLGAYNAQFLPSWLTGDGPITRLVTDGGFKATSFDDIEDRPRKLADLILASDYDVIALSEMFDPFAVDELVTRLGDAYPHQVRFLGGAPGRRVPLEPTWDEVRESILGQNSGLMLFSRFPFAEFPEAIPAPFRPAPGDFSAVRGDGSGDHSGDDGTPWEHVAFTEFERCHGWLAHAGDCFGRKGAAMVRIRNPFSDDFYNIVFTHLEAGGTAIERDIRRTELEQVRDMMAGVLTDAQLENEAVLVLGDLNIHGERPLAGMASDRPEWDEHFSVGATSLGGFFSPPAGAVHDVREFDTQHPLVLGAFPGQVDRGITSDTMGVEEKRIDYILSNFRDDGPFSVQHLYRSWNLWDGEPFRAPGMGRGGRQPLSDHWGLTVEINRRAPRSSPEDATIVSTLPDARPGSWPTTFETSGDIETAFFDSENTALIDGTLEHPGSFQWYLLPEGGTYTIAIDGNERVDFRMYQSSNLSEPYQGTGYRGQSRDLTFTEWITPGDSARDEPNSTVPGKGDDTIRIPRPVPRTIEGRKYGLMEPPVYIRVFGINEAGEQDRTVAGAYRLIVHKHQGASMEDAIILLPNQRGAPMRFPVDGATETYFQIDTEGPDSGAAQTLSFFVDPSDLNAYRVEVLDAIGAPLRERVVYGEPAVAAIELREEHFNWQQLFLRATVFPESHARLAEFLPWWTTDLFVVQPQSIYVNQQVNRPPFFRDDNDVRLHGSIAASTGRIELPTQGFGNLDQKNLREVSWAPLRLLAGELLDLRVDVQADRRGPFPGPHVGPRISRTKHLSGAVYESTLTDTDGSAATSFTDELVLDDGPWSASVRLERELSSRGPRIRKEGLYTFNFLVSHWLHQEGVMARRPLSGDASLLPHLGLGVSALPADALAKQIVTAHPSLVAPTGGRTKQLGLAAADPVLVGPALGVSADANVHAVLRKARGNSNQLYVVLLDKNSNQETRRFRSPLQPLSHSRIRVATRDLNGDGLADHVLITGVRGTRIVKRVRRI